MLDLELAELFDFPLLIEDLLEWLFVFDEAVEHLSSSRVSFSQQWTFFLKLKIISSTSLSHSSLLLTCFSFRYFLHYSCAVTTNFKMSLNSANSSSTATSFFLEQSRSLMAPLLLRNLEYILCLSSFIWDNLYSLLFDDGFFSFCPLPKLLWFYWTLLFCLNRFNPCWCILPRRFDIHLCVSSGWSLTLP